MGGRKKEREEKEKEGGEGGRSTTILSKSPKAARKIINARCHYFQFCVVLQALDFALYVFMQVSVIFGRALPPGFF